MRKDVSDVEYGASTCPENAIELRKTGPRKVFIAAPKVSLS